MPDPSSLTPFFGNVIGLVPGETNRGDTLTWRDDNRVHRLIVQPGPANDASFVGFEATDSAAFDRVVARLRTGGFDVQDGSAAEVAARRVGRLVHTAAPWGIPVEIVEGLEPAASEFASPLVPGGFLTEGVGFGHVVFATTAPDESHAFLVDGLGFAQSDWLETEIAEGVPLVARFYHCNPRHHTVALAHLPFEVPQRLHHIMFETKDRDDVGAAFDRVWATDLAIPNGLGRHPNDGMFSFYVAGPAGFQVEVGYGGRVVTEPWDDNRAYDRVSGWGHQALR